jgi:hypothetical protein
MLGICDMVIDKEFRNIGLVGLRNIKGHLHIIQQGVCHFLFAGSRRYLWL